MNQASARVSSSLSESGATFSRRDRMIWSVCGATTVQLKVGWKVLSTQTFSDLRAGCCRTGFSGFSVNTTLNSTRCDSVAKSSPVTPYFVLLCGSAVSQLPLDVNSWSNNDSCVPNELKESEFLSRRRLQTSAQKWSFFFFLNRKPWNTNSQHAGTASGPAGHFLSDPLVSVCCVIITAPRWAR